MVFRFVLFRRKKAGEVDIALELMDRMEACVGYGDASAYNQVNERGKDIFFFALL